MFTGLRSIIYPTKSLEEDKKFWAKATGVKPYFEQPFYVGFDIHGCELGLDPNASKEGITYPVTYWKVDDIQAAVKHVIESGAVENASVHDVGGGILMARYEDPSGNIFGLIQMPAKS